MVRAFRYGLLVVLVASGSVPSASRLAAADEVILPFGSEFRVSSYTGYAPGDAAVCMSSDGGFIVVWVSDRDPIDNDVNLGEWGIFARRFSPLGEALGPEFHVNEEIAGVQREPHVAQSPAGAYFVTWTSTDISGDEDHSEVRARLFAGDGQALTAELMVSSSATADNITPAVAALDSDSYVVSWARALLPAGRDAEVFAQRFDALGQRSGSEFRVNSGVEGDQVSPAIATLPDGAFVIAWTDVVASFPDWLIGTTGKLFDGDGQEASADLVFGSVDEGKRRLPVISASPAGDFVVAWAAGDYDDEFTNPGARDVLVRRFAHDGSALGDAFSPHEDHTGRQVAPGVAHAGNGGFVVVWEDGYGPAYDGDAPDRDGDSYGIFARVFDEDGQPSSSEFQVNTYTTGNQWFGGPPTRALGADAEGNFVVVWIDNYDLIGRRFCRFESTAAACGDADCLGAQGSTTDALVLLRAAIGVRQCSRCVCDSDSSGAITAADALRVLRVAMGLPEVLVCPPCG